LSTINKKIIINDYLLKKLTCGDFIKTHDNNLNSFFYDSKNKTQDGNPIVGVIIDKFELRGSLVYKDILHNGLINKYDTNLFLYANQKNDYVDFRIIYMSQQPDFNKQNKLVVVKNGDIKTELQFTINFIDYVDESTISWFNLNNDIAESFNRSIYDFYSWLKTESRIECSFEKI
jgi:hypothetical protein